MQKFRQPVLFSLAPGRQSAILRFLLTLILATTLFLPLLATCGCHDVEGAASKTANQTNERENRNKEVTDILDSGEAKKP